MATRARCKSHLDEAHVCHGGAAAVAGWATDVFAGALLGGLGGVLLFRMASQISVAQASDLAGFLVGWYLATVVLRSVRRTAFST